VTVKQAITAVELDQTSIESTPGQKFTLNATVSPASAASKKLRWTSTNSTVASVDATGTVSVNGYGSCAILATADDTGAVKAECTIRVPSFFDTDFYSGGGIRDELGLFNEDERTALTDGLTEVINSCFEKYGSVAYPDIIVYTCCAKEGESIADATVKAAEVFRAALNQEYNLYAGEKNGLNGPVLITINVWQDTGRASVNVLFTGDAVSEALGDAERTEARRVLLDGFKTGSYVTGLLDYVRYTAGILTEKDLNH